MLVVLVAGITCVGIVYDSDLCNVVGRAGWLCWNLVVGDMNSEGIMRMKGGFGLRMYADPSAYVKAGTGDAMVPRELVMDIEAGQSDVCLPGCRGVGYGFREEQEDVWGQSGCGARSGRGVGKQGGVMGNSRAYWACGVVGGSGACVGKWPAMGYRRYRIGRRRCQPLG
jgi:hypothetical protein